MIEGWYYLHTNGDLIYKRDFPGIEADIRESPFARALWPLDTHDRENAWTILVEALAAGVNPKRIDELSEKWACDDADAKTYIERLGLKLSLDGNAWCVTKSDFGCLATDPAGFGGTILEAMADLCKQLGYAPSKMWGATFKGLCKAVATPPGMKGEDDVNPSIPLRSDPRRRV
jgi:hypothetical protein